MFTELSDSDTQSAEDEQRLEAVVNAGPSGAMALAGVSVAIVLAIWLAFYLFVYLPLT